MVFGSSRYAYPDANGHVHSHCDSNGDGYGNCDCDFYAHGDSYSDPNTDVYSKAYSNCKTQPGTKTSSHSTAQTLIPDVISDQSVPAVAADAPHATPNDRNRQWLPSKTVVLPEPRAKS